MGTVSAGGQGRLGSLWNRFRGLGRRALGWLAPEGEAARPAAIPPSDLLFRSTGCESAEWYVKSGDQSYQEFADVLAACRRSFDEFRTILDFGCGCGRILRALRNRLPGARLCASDQDEAAVAWLRKTYQDVNLRTNGPLPPLAFAAGTFDLVLGFSVFTHLSESYQDAWLHELRRVTRPGAFLLLTVHGSANWDKTLREHQPLRDSPELPALESALGGHGFAHWRGDGWSQFFPDFYHTTWHLPAYIREHWARWFRVLEIWPTKALANQDIVVLRHD
jgi:SAM-dependent methyltransferase